MEEVDLIIWVDLGSEEDFRTRLWLLTSILGNFSWLLIALGLELALGNRRYWWYWRRRCWRFRILNGTGVSWDFACFSCQRWNYRLCNLFLKHRRWKTRDRDGFESPVNAWVRYLQSWYPKNHGIYTNWSDEEGLGLRYISNHELENNLTARVYKYTIIGKDDLYRGTRLGIET